jgi:hypothetical protein
LRRFVKAAVREKLNVRQWPDKPWMRGFGGLAPLHEENVRIQELIDEEFGKIDPEDWE